MEVAAREADGGVDGDGVAGLWGELDLGGGAGLEELEGDVAVGVGEVEVVASDFLAAAGEDDGEASDDGEPVAGLVGPGGPVGEVEGAGGGLPAAGAVDDGDAVEGELRAGGRDDGVDVVVAVELEGRGVLGEARGGAVCDGEDDGEGCEVAALEVEVEAEVALPVVLADEVEAAEGGLGGGVRGGEREGEDEGEEEWDGDSHGGTSRRGLCCVA